MSSTAAGLDASMNDTSSALTEESGKKQQARNEDASEVDNTMGKSKKEAPTGSGSATGTAAKPKGASEKPDEDPNADGGVGVLSDEQTNAALAALQEASTMMIEQKQAEEEKEKAAQAKKRKTPDAAPEETEKPPAKKRSTPMRVSWEDRMEQLREYKEKHGDLLIPIRFKENKSLGKFVHNTREQFKLYHKKTPEGYKKKCSLTAERIKQLDDLGFVWSTQRTEKQNDEWEKRLEELKEYKKEHGDCLVPHGYTNPNDPEDRSFAEWIHRQRTTYASMAKQKNENPMIKARMDKLKALGFNFTVHSDKWMDHWNMLKEYKEKNGHVQVPTHHAESPKLGRWVHTQRHQRRLQLKGKKSCMTQERVDLLNQLGFSWEVRPSLERPRATWRQRYDELKAFHSKNQHFRVPVATPQLSAWVQEQKHRLKNVDKNGKDTSKRMGPDRVKALAEIGFTKDSETVELTVTAANAAAAAAITATTLPSEKAVPSDTDAPAPDLAAPSPKRSPEEEAQQVEI